MPMREVKITARHIKITAEMRQYLQDKLKALDHYFDQIKRIEVIISNDKDRFVIEAVAAVDYGKKLVSKAADYNYIAAINDVTNKIEKQLIKFKDKIKRPHHRAPLAPQKSGGLEQEDWY